MKQTRCYDVLVRESRQGRRERICAEIDVQGGDTDIAGSVGGCGTQMPEAYGEGREYRTDCGIDACQGRLAREPAFPLVSPEPKRVCRGAGVSDAAARLTMKRWANLCARWRLGQRVPEASDDVRRSRLLSLRSPHKGIEAGVDRGQCQWRKMWCRGMSWCRRRHCEHDSALSSRGSRMECWILPISLSHSPFVLTLPAWIIYLLNRPPRFFAPYPAKPDFDAIHGVLQLGTKYRVEHLQRRALQDLSSAHPTSLAAWDALCAASPAASTSQSHRGACVGFPGGLEPVGGGGVGVGVGGVVAAYAGPLFDPAHLELPILTLARAVRAPWVLPTALLRAAAALTSGTLTSLDILEGIDYTGVHVELERGDKVLLLEAGGVLLGKGTSELLGFLWSPTLCKYHGGHRRSGEYKYKRTRRHEPLHREPPRHARRSRALAVGRPPPDCGLFGGSRGPQNKHRDVLW
ncbi:hypothetical protein B0H13DRAFT_1876165 [Mycena leptocephala]|nr:hypothetical protein B0H13DRAFT_1876165 [Mycena leptocephala]